MVEELQVPITCKIRIFPSEERTLNFCKALESTGISLLTVHGRTKEQNKHLVGTCDWEIIAKIKRLLSIPVIANGGIHTFKDVQDCIAKTGVDGVMSAEALLENPALFSGKIHDLDELALEYLELWKEYGNNDKRYVKGHLFKIAYEGLRKEVDLRDRMQKALEVNEMEDILKQLKERRKDVSNENKFGWYERYQNFAPQIAESKNEEQTQQNKEVKNTPDDSEDDKVIKKLKET